MSDQRWIPGGVGGQAAPTLQWLVAMAIAKACAPHVPGTLQAIVIVMPVDEPAGAALATVIHPLKVGGVLRKIADVTDAAADLLRGQ